MHFSHHLICLFGLMLFCFSADAQCLTGTIGASGAGCGCLSGCNLSAFGGPNCGGGLGGNCDGGSQNISIEWNLPAGCGVRVEARMSNRPGCSASGADSGDRLKVEGNTPKSWQNGASNATLFDVQSQVGGTIGVYAQANRQDEIVSYELFFESGACPFCILLPVELASFNAQAEGRVLLLDWSTYTERGNEGWFLETSRDQVSWSSQGFVRGAGDSSEKRHYHQAILLPEDGLHYVRLRQVDFNGNQGLSPTVTVNMLAEKTFDIQSISEDRFRVLGGGEAASLKVLEVYNASGQKVLQWEGRLEDQREFQLQGASGLFLVVLKDPKLGTQSSVKVLLR